MNGLLSYECLCYSGYSGTKCENRILDPALEGESSTETVKTVTPGGSNILDQSKWMDPFANKQGNDMDAQTQVLQ